MPSKNHEQDRLLEDSGKNPSRMVDDAQDGEDE